MNCSLCDYYEAENEADLQAHKRWGHTPAQVLAQNGGESADLARKLSSLGYGPTLATGPTYTVSSSSTYPPPIPASVRDFGPSGYVLPNGIKVLQVVRTAPGTEAWEVEDPLGLRTYEAHPLGQFDYESSPNLSRPRQKLTINGLPGSPEVPW